MWESRTCDNLTVIHRVRSETMWPLFRQRKQADNTSHSYDITRRSYWATENRLFDTVFRFIPRSFPFFFCHERTNVCGISIRTSKETAFNSFRKYKEKYNISRQYNITQPALLSLRFGYYLWGIKFFFCTCGLSIFYTEAMHQRKREIQGSKIYIEIVDLSQIIFSVIFAKEMIKSLY